MTIQSVSSAADTGKHRKREPEKARVEANVAKSDDDLLTTEEVVLWTGFSKQSFEGWRSRKNGGPPFIKFSQSVRYRRGDIKTWLSSLTITPVSQ